MSLGASDFKAICEGNTQQIIPAPINTQDRVWPLIIGRIGEFEAPETLVRVYQSLVNIGFRAV